MESIRRLVWALERGQALGLDENQVAGHSITRGERLGLTYGWQSVKSFPWLKIVLIIGELFRTHSQQPVHFSFDLLPGCMFEMRMYLDVRMNLSVL